MRIILNLSAFAFMWLSLVSGSAWDLGHDQDTFNIDVKIICNGEHIKCVCNQGSASGESPYFMIHLKRLYSQHGDKSFESVVQEDINVIIQQFQSAGILPGRNFTYTSMQLIRKDLAPDYDGECAALWQASMAKLLNELDAIKNVALEIRVDKTPPNERSGL